MMTRMIKVVNKMFQKYDWIDSATNYEAKCSRQKIDEVPDLLDSVMSLDSWFDSVGAVRKHVPAKNANTWYFSSHMDKSVNPCDDFYEFACGQFTRTAAADTNAFTQVNNVTTRRLRKMLTKDIKDGDSMPLQKAKLFFNVCMNDESHKEDPILPIYKKIKDLGGWPLQEDVDDQHSSDRIIELVRKARDMGYDTNAMFTVNIVPNVKDTTERILVISPPPLVVPVSQGSPTKIEEKLVTDYCTLMLLIGYQFLQYSEADTSEDAQLRLFSQVVETLRFELLLAKLYPKAYTDGDLFDSYNVQTIAEIQSLYPFLDWLAYIQAILGPTVTISRNEKVMLSGPIYFGNLNNAYSKLTDRRVVKNYILWRYILLSLRVSLVMMPERARWKGCLSITQAGFEPIIAAKYMRSYFSSADREPVVDMVTRMNKVMYKMFQKYDWIDSATKQNVLDKIDEIVTRVAYTEDMLNSDVSLAPWFDSLDISPNDYFTSVMCLIKLGLDRVASSLHERIDRKQWPPYISTMSANAYYIPIENSISIPAALLQKELYSPDRPLYLNYGSVGFIIGHELSHAFDNVGRFHDKFGNRNLSLWDADTTKGYEEREECFVRQYDKYKLGKTGIHLNGMMTLGENMADNEGVTLAYKAYNTWTRENRVEMRLPALDYTPEQMFWISLANVWCSRMNDTILKRISRTDPHAPAKVRVIGMVSNQESFAQDFHCPPGSPMNPPKKCTFE